MSNSTIGKMTLLEMTQAVLEKMESDEVNTITETVESLAVAGEIRDTYRSMVSNSEDYSKVGYRQLEGLSDSRRFNQLRIPDNVVTILELWLDDPIECSKRIQVEYLEPEDFVNRAFKRGDKRQASVPPYGQEGPCFPVGCESDPKCYTSFDGKTVFFDSVDTRAVDTLCASRSAIRALIFPEFKMEDGFVPDLKVSDFQYLLQDSIDASFINFKGVSNSKAQRRAREQKVKRQNKRDTIGHQANTFGSPPYGRHSRGGSLQNLQGGGTQNS